MSLQVCALQWSRHEKEILSSHGFSQNQLCLWKYPSMAKVRAQLVCEPDSMAQLPGDCANQRGCISCIHIEWMG